MAVTTKTFTENYYGTHQAAWTINYNRSDIIVTGATFRIKPLTITAKYVASGKNRGSVDLNYDALIGAALVGAFNAVYPSNYMVTGNTYTIPSTDAIGDDKSTSTYFNSNNPTAKTIALTYQSNSIDVASWRNATDDWWNGWSTATQGLIGTVNIVLDAPPSVTLGTPTYANPQYAGLGAYSVPLTTLSAQYGGNITKVTLTIGTDVTTQTYSAQTVSGQTISVTPTAAGTYTPVLTVEDSRGQITTRTLSSITVNGYINPSVSFNVDRTTSAGVLDDEGHYALITANVSFTDAIADLTTPTVVVKDSNGTTVASTVTWYDTYSTSTGVSGVISDWTTIDSGDTIYAVIDCNYGNTGVFGETESYQITLTITDSQGGSSNPITQTLSTAFYTIDFQAGGKEVAFGTPANDSLSSYPDGLFKCNMDALFMNDATINGPFYNLDTSAGSGTDHDLYAAITALGWGSDLVSSDIQDVKKTLTKILEQLKKPQTETADKTSSSKSIAANSAGYIDVDMTDVTPNGYTLIGVVGLSSNASGAVPITWYVNSASTVRVYYRNITSSAVSQTVTIYGLFRKST